MSKMWHITFGKKNQGSGTSLYKKMLIAINFAYEYRDGRISLYIVLQHMQATTIVFQSFGKL